MYKILHIPSARIAYWGLKSHDFDCGSTNIEWLKQSCNNYNFYMVFEDDMCYFLPENMIKLWPERFLDIQKIRFEHLEFIPVDANV